MNNGNSTSSGDCAVNYEVGNGHCGHFGCGFRVRDLGFTHTQQGVLTSFGRVGTVEMERGYSWSFVPFQPVFKLPSSWRGRATLLHTDGETASARGPLFASVNLIILSTQLFTGYSFILLYHSSLEYMKIHRHATDHRHASENIQ